ncbi:hypothetical protein ZIOFF_018020 [Zingiber officinale]|uniref:Cupin type-1 domain-containing protein n=1 Tax=Zingiber officinale TaxID=94328 RepID=A0A8J5H5I9_ZINOF|nr:hypothetical protein ZIOFF_018020 [Zingiber officinale]
MCSRNSLSSGFIQLIATRGVLQWNAISAPHWNIDAHSVVYALRGSCCMQVVDHRVRIVFDGAGGGRLRPTAAASARQGPAAAASGLLLPPAPGRCAGCCRPPVGCWRLCQPTSGCCANRQLAAGATRNLKNILC